MSTKSGEAVNAVANCKTGASPLPQFSDVRVLVVDDEAPARNVLALVLAQIGHRCEKAANGEQTQQLREALREVERSYEHTLEALGVAVDLRDSSTAGHSRRVFLYSIEIAKAMGGLEHELKNIAMGAWLHDIGKLAIPDAILLKPGSR